MSEPSRTMRLASVDIGTLICRLLIADLQLSRRLGGGRCDVRSA